MITASVGKDGKVNLVGKQGTTWSLVVQVFQDDLKTVPMNLNGYAARGQFKKDYVKSSPVLIEFNCTVLPLDLDSNPDQNKVLIEATPDQSSSVTIESGVYDIEVYNGPLIVERILEGSLTISKEVTRNE